MVVPLAILLERDPALLQEVVVDRRSCYRAPGLGEEDLREPPETACACVVLCTRTDVVKESM